MEVSNQSKLPRSDLCPEVAPRELEILLDLRSINMSLLRSFCAKPYSDREMLQRAISRYRDQGCGVWPEDQLPAKSGYFRAQYSRQDDAEFFDYSPDPEEIDVTRVWIITPSSRSDSSGLRK
jgi:hypothetical protein